MTSRRCWLRHWQPWVRTTNVRSTGLSSSLVGSLDYVIMYMIGRKNKYNLLLIITRRVNIIRCAGVEEQGAGNDRCKPGVLPSNSRLLMNRIAIKYNDILIYVIICWEYYCINQSIRIIS